MSKSVLLLRVFATSRCVLGTRPARNRGCDVIAPLRGAASFFRDTQSNAGAPYTYVTIPYFLSAFGMVTLRNLPNVEALECAI